MLYYQLVIAAFIALASEVIGAPIKSAKPFVIKGNDKNILVTGTAIGGNGGTNVAYTNGAAVPIVINGGYRGSGNIFAEAYQANSVSQSANGGGAIVAGVARDLEDEDMERRSYNFPPAPVIKGNNKNIAVLGAAQGGNGGNNWAYTSGAAAPVVYTSGKGYTYVTAEQINSVGQSANGGGAIVAGVVARDFDDEDMERRAYYSPPAPVIKGNTKNIVVVGTAQGGIGGTNWAYTSGAAAPVVYANGKGYTFVSAEQINSVGQSADGGSAAVIGKSSKRSETKQRTCSPPPPVVSHNNGNTQVQGVAIGGNGGFNFANTVGVAVPVVIGGNSGSVIASQNNNVGQSANGGSAVVAGKYRRDISFEVEEDEDEDDLVARKFTFPTFVDNKGNTVVVGSAAGGTGGWNEASTSGAAVPVVISSGNKWSSGYINVAAMQGNSVGQSADGGSAAVIGKSS